MALPILPYIPTRFRAGQAGRDEAGEPQAQVQYTRDGTTWANCIPSGSHPTDADAETAAEEEAARLNEGYRKIGQLLPE